MSTLKRSQLFLTPSLNLNNILYSFLYNKTKWSEEEERLLFQLYQKHGPKWCYLVNQFKNRTENSIKNRFYSTLRRVATEHKRSIEKYAKKNKKSKPKANISNQSEQSVENKENLNFQKDELYLENPQIAKTEELLKFLPLVIKSLKAFTKDLPKSSSVGKSNKRGKRKTKTNKRKRVSEKLPKDNKKNSYKRQRISEELIEENKNTEEDTLIEKSNKQEEKVVLTENKNSNIINIEELDPLTKNQAENMEIDYNEIRSEINMQCNNKQWLSVKSEDNLIDHFPDDPFNKMEEDHQSNEWMIEAI